MKRLDELALVAGLTIAGNESLYVNGIRYANEATETDLAVAFNRREIEKTKAWAVLTEPQVISDNKTLLYCAYNGVIAALAKVAPLFGIDDKDEPHYHPAENGCFFGDSVQIGENSRISPGVIIGDDVTIGNEVCIEPQVHIGSRTVIGDFCAIRAGAKIGAASFLHYEEQGIAKAFAGIGRTILGNGVTVGYNSVIQRGTLGDTILADNVLIGNLVVIAHDVHIGENSRLVCQSGIAGQTNLGDHVIIMGQSGAVSGISIGNFVTVMAKSVVTKNIETGERVSGVYGRNHKEELRKH